MIGRRENGEEIYTKLKFFNGGISYQNSSEGSIIYPDYEYWAERLGEVKADEIGWDWIKNNEERSWFFLNYWVPAWLYFRVIDMCDELEIPHQHAHNIVIPLVDFEMADKSLIGDDIRDVARDVIKLRDLFSDLENRYNRVISITFKVGRITGIRKNTRYEYRNEKRITVSIPRAIDPFIESLQRLIRSDIKLNQHVYNSGYLSYENFKLKQHYKDNQNLLSVILFEYLDNFKLIKSARDGYIKTGKFMSLMKNDYMIDQQTFDENPEDYLDYESYDHYAADVMGKRIKRWYQNVTKKSEN